MPCHFLIHQINHSKICYFILHIFEEYLIFLFRRNRHFHTHLGHNHATMGLDVAKSILNVFGFIVLQVPRDISAANLIPLLMPYKYRTSYFSTHALANVINLICENYKQKVTLVFRHGTIFETCKNFVYNGFLTSSAHGVLKWSNIQNASWNS